MRSLANGVYAAWVAASLAAAGPAQAEAPRPEALLWTASPLALPAIDFDPARTGLELLTYARACSVSSPDANGLVTVTRKIKIKVYAADGETVVMAPSGANVLKSDPFPDPRLSRFQCGGANPTSYSAQFPGADATEVTQGYGIPRGASSSVQCVPGLFDAANSLCDEMPVSTFGVTVAKVGSQRVVLLSQAMNLTYYNNVVNADGIASAFSITAYALDGVELWTRRFPGVTSDGFKAYGNLARVADYLGSDGKDEIRIVYLGEGGVRYRLVDPLTGNTLSTITPAPPTF